MAIAFHQQRFWTRLVISSPITGAPVRQWLGVSLAILASVALTAQQTSLPSAHGSSATPAVERQTQNVFIDVAVSDRSGKPVRGLQERNFTLLDDKQTKTPTSFRTVDLDAGTPAPPIEIMLVIDAINADVMQAERQRDGAKKFLQANGGKLALPVSLVTVTDTGILPIEAYLVMAFISR